MLVFKYNPLLGITFLQRIDLLHRKRKHQWLGFFFYLCEFLVHVDLIPVLIGTGLPVQQDDCSKQILLKITQKNHNLLESFYIKKGH